MTTKYRPSQLARGEVCPGYLSRLRDIPPQPESVWAKRGTVLHSIAASVLQWDREPRIGDQLDGYVLTEQDIDSIMTYVDFVRSLPPSSERYIEKRVQIVPGVLEGTADYVSYDTPSDTLTVVDYKSGYLYVPHIDNLQLLCYAVGAVRTFLLDPATIRTVVVQPECSDPIRQQVISRTQLPGIEERINRILQSADENVDQFTYDKDNCRFCAVREARQCPLFHVPQSTSVDILGDTFTRVKEQVDYLSDLLSILETDMIERLKRGETAQRYELHSRRTARKWTVDEKELQILGEALNVDMYKKSLISPGEAEKRGVSKAVLDTVSEYGTSVRVKKR